MNRRPVAASYNNPGYGLFDTMDSPEFLGPYRIGEVLGRGGMGTVFSAVHEKTKQLVAVKLIAAHVADEMRFRRRFDAEVETLKRLRHPGIVQLIGYGEENGQLFYSMELVKGETLQKRIRREKRLGWLETLDIAIQICAALKHAHDFGVIHRDLKPANLILTAQDQVKLVDFGVAKIFGSLEHTAVGSVMGTADYMAPEQAAGSGVTVRTDLYALGSVLYAILTGRPPFTGKKITEVIHSLQRKKPVPLDMVNPDLPEDLVALVHQLLAKAPEDRPPTALAVMNRLKAMRAGLQHQKTLLERESKDRRDEDVESEGVDAGGQTSMAGLTNVSGDELTSIPPDDAGNTNHPTGQHGRDTRPNTASARKQPSESSEPRSVAAAEDVTLVSEKTAASGSDVSLEKPIPKTHFRTVDEDQQSAALAHPDADGGGTIAHGLSIGLLIAALLFGIVFVIIRIQKPSADEIFASIRHQESIGELSKARGDIDQFMKLYPHDSRIDEVRRHDTTLRLSGLVRRLQLKENIGLKPLDAHEQALLEAFTLRQGEPMLAAKKLGQWLDVFGEASSNSDEERIEMAELARFEYDRLMGSTSTSPAEPTNQDSRLFDLMHRIRASAELEPDERRRMLEGIVSLYENTEWAALAVESAKEQLEHSEEAISTESSASDE